MNYRTFSRSEVLRNGWDLREGKYDVDFKLFSMDTSAFGSTYVDSKRIHIFLHPHETLEQIIATINHELFHAAMEREDIEADFEHNVIRYLMWSMSDMVIDEDD